MMPSFHQEFETALSKWRKMGGAMNYYQPIPGEDSGQWSVWSFCENLEETITCSARDATVEALRQGGMDEQQIAEEMADFLD